MKRRFIFFILVFLFLKYSYAQNPTVKTFIDRDNILIGEQLKYKVVASFSTNNFKTNWFVLPDSMPHFELIEKGKIDSAFANTTITLTQEIILTSFDSGKWNTPAFAVNFLSTNTKTIKLFTDSMTVNVAYAPADSTNQLRDIKPIIESDTKPNYRNIIVCVLIGLLLLFLFIYLIRRFTKKVNPINAKTFTSAYDEAMESIEKLKEHNLNDAEQVKYYHIALSQIVKKYFSRTTKVNMLNKTTGDVLIYLNGNDVSNQIITYMATVLRCGDAVKFAKFLPAPNESEDCLQKIKNTIQFIHTNKSTTT
jgi:hypothetical protein